MTPTNQLIEFRDTPEFRQRLADFIEKFCQVPRPDLADCPTPELLGMAQRHYTHAIHAAAHRLTLFLASANVPVLDLELHAQCEDLAAAAQQFRPTKEIVAKWAKVPADRILEFGHDAEDFRARGGRYLEEIGVYVILDDAK